MHEKYVTLTLMVLLTASGCEGGSNECGAERGAPPGCTLVFSGECPAQDRYRCGDEICDHSGTSCRPAEDLDASVGDAADGATNGPSDAATDAANDDGSAPATFACTTDELTTGDQCNCLADAVCTQIYTCLDAADLAGREPSWSPIATCLESVRSDCNEDLRDPSSFPTDFVGCMTDIQMASCGDFGTFMSISDDFPASCANLRTVDTGLGISL